MLRDKSSLAGCTLMVHPNFEEGNLVDGATIVIEDYWENVAGQSWMDSDGNPAALNYAMRSGLGSPQLPLDNEVLYGKIGSLGYLVHVSEVTQVPAEAEAVPA